MDELTVFAVAHAIGNTHCAMDRARNAVILRGLPEEDKQVVQRLMMDAHRTWLEWVTITQRKWQGKTRRPSKARHHDSIQIREKYVRCV